MPEVMIPGFECSRCTHQWVPRDKNEKPTVCPKCKTPYWDKPRKKSIKKGGKL